MSVAQLERALKNRKKYLVIKTKITGSYSNSKTLSQEDKTISFQEINVGSIPAAQ